SILALQFCLGTCLDHLGRRHELGELWDCQLGNFTAGKDSEGGKVCPRCRRDAGQRRGGQPVSGWDLKMAGKKLVITKKSDRAKV
ncbi:hypothetical protein Tco_0575831, partial [Tanacetum coccineum]